MKNKISEEDMAKLLKASIGSKIRLQVSQCISEHFKSAHYLSSRLLCDCVLLNLVLNDEITPSSADEIISTVHRNNKAFFSTVDSAYYPIECAFTEYAKSILGDGFGSIYDISPRITNFIVYVFSLDLSRKNLDKKELILRAYSYRELAENSVPHY